MRFQGSHRAFMAQNPLKKPGGAWVGGWVGGRVGATPQTHSPLHGCPPPPHPTPSTHTHTPGSPRLAHTSCTAASGEMRDPGRITPCVCTRCFTMSMGQ